MRDLLIGGRFFGPGSSMLVALTLACALYLRVVALVQAADSPASSEPPAHVDFTTLDTNKNRRIEVDEVLAAMPAERHAVARRTFGVFDFDGDGTLTEQEYGCFPLAPPNSGSGRVPDPVAEWAEAEIARAGKLLQEHDANADGALQKTEWEGPTSTAWYSGEFRILDANADGAASMEEIRKAIEVCFGLREANGKELRRPNGSVFLWDTFFRAWDEDRDLALVRREFVPKYWLGIEAAEKAFAQTDSDADGRMTLPELLQSDFAWCDVVGRFLSLDKDLDGRLSGAELEQGLLPSELACLAQLVPGYDVQGSRTLSLAEYRATPLANPVLDWRRRRRDLNGDGLLDLSEFHPGKGIEFLGLSKRFFERLDRDNSGLLDPAELEFDTDIGGLPREGLFAALDSDRDGQLTLSEAVGDPQQASPFYSRHQAALDEADANTDATIDVGELANSPELMLAIRQEHWWRNTIKPTFAQKDANGDSVLSKAEWLASTKADKAVQAQCEFALCDFDSNNQLSMSEYACLPSVSPRDRRGPVLDPVVQELDRLMEHVSEWLKGAKRPVGEVLASISELGPGVTPRAVPSWDGDGDGLLTLTEIRRGLEVAYGVRHPRGSRLRLENGTVFDWRTFQAYDGNSDEFLSSEEFARRYWGGPEKARAVLADADADRDGRLTVAELEHGTLLWVNTFETFGRFDTNWSGTIDPQELSSQAKSWERNYAAMSFPAFDTDGSGSLSFVEFRATPLGNSLADWNGRRSDKDGDARLSLAEFHDRPSPALQGLSAFFFQRLDRDRDGALSVSELPFHLDPKRMDLELVFRVLDTNHDNGLSLAEAVGLLPRPAQTENAAARNNYESKVMRIEDAFGTADRDRSGDVSWSEFNDPEATLASVITGRPIPTRQPKQPVALVQPRTWNWRFIGLVVLNIGLLGGLAWLLLRRPARS